MCTIAGCDGKAVSNGLCAKHYMRLRRTGDPNVTRRPGVKATGPSKELSDKIAAGMPSFLAVPHFQQIIGTKARLTGTPVADPFVIASAGVRNGTVVTQERRKPNSAKIPTVCDHFGIKSVNLEDFMRNIGWTFS
jgi:hypothetical protein